MGQGNSTLGPKYFRQKLARASFLTNYSGPLVEFPCPTPVHMKDTLILICSPGVFELKSQ